MKTDFSWSSPLGISSALFIVIAVIYILIGGLGFIITMWKSYEGIGAQFYLSKQADEMLFGKPIEQVIRDSPTEAKYITMLMIIFCSFMVGMGVLQWGVAKYALTAGLPWAYWCSVISNAFMLLVYWFVIIIPVLRQLHIGYFSLWHPYALIPTLLFPFAIVFGWIGLKN